MKKLFISILSIGLLYSCSNNDNSNNDTINNIDDTTKVTYKVEVSLDWTAKKYPENFPSNDHFSPLIGWIHNNETSFFNVNTVASDGIKQMAETGATSLLKTELTDKIKNGEGLSIVSGSGLETGKGIITIDKIVLTKDFPLVTLATMIAPSPDWYVAIKSTNLYENGKFVDEKTVEAHAYDAGTDSGSNYTSTNKKTSPQEMISQINNSIFNKDKIIATVKFTKL